MTIWLGKEAVKKCFIACIEAMIGKVLVSSRIEK
jgi:hypothetical protein